MMANRIMGKINFYLHKISKLFILVFFLFFLFACKSNKELVTEQKPDVRAEAVFIDGVKNRLLGNTDEALRYFQAYLLKFPHSAAAYFNISKVYFNTGDYTAAYDAIQKSVELAPDNLAYNMLLIDCAIQTNRLEIAYSTYEHVLKLSPDNTDFWKEYLDLLQQFQNYHRADNVVHLFEKKFGVSEFSLRYKYQNFVRLNLPDSIENTLVILHEYYPENMDYPGILAEFYVSRKQFQRADSLYKQMLAFYVPRGNIYLSMANFERIRGDKQKEFTYLVRAFSDSTLDYNQKINFFRLLRKEKEFPDSLLYDSVLTILQDLYPNRAEIFLIRAKYLYENADYTGAIPLFQKVNDLSSGNFRMWMMLLDAEYRTNRFDDLYDDANKALELYPTQASLYLFSGIAALRTGREKEAVNVLKNGLDYLIDNTNLELQFFSYLGEAYNSLKQYSLSDTYFDKALELDSANLLIRNNYAYYLSLRVQHLDKAKSLILYCLQQDANNYIFLDTYAWILFQSGEYDKALEIERRAIELGGESDADILKHFVEILKALSKDDEAVEYEKKLNELN